MQRSHIMAICGLVVSQAAAAQAVESTPPTAGGKPAAEAPGATRSADDQILGEIIVTASRRSDTIRKTPTAVSAYTGQKLEAAETKSLGDLVGPSPNIQIGNSYNSSNITIRGIGNQQINAGQDSGVAIHSDGVYIGQPSLTLATFLDLARVEILRGPQGTLFGRNATGGVINVVPNEPTTDTQAGVNITAGVDPALFQTSGFINGALNASGTLSGRVAAQQSYNRGYTRNLLPNGPNRLDDADNQSVRGQLRWEPSDTFNARFLAEYANDSSNGPASFLDGTPDPSIPLPSILVGQSRGDVDKREVYANINSRAVHSFNTDLTLNWTLGGGEMKALLSYSDSVLKNVSDGDGTAAPDTYSSFTNKAHQTYDELIYTSDNSRSFTYLLGANFFREHLEQAIEVPIHEAPLGGGVVLKDIAVLGGAHPLITTSYAAFGRIQYAFTSGAKVFAGLRQTQDKKSITQYNNFINGGVDQSSKSSWNKLTYEVGASYPFSQNLDGYLKYATGFKGGGYSAGTLAPSFRPETNGSFEAGLKGNFFDRALQANLAAFHMKYDDLQVNQIVGVSSSVTNAAKATVYGAELETSLRLSEALRLEWSAAYLNATFDQFKTADSSRPTTCDPGTGIGAVPCSLDLSGNTLPQSPRYTSSVGAYYDIPLSSGVITPSVRYDWKSRVYFTEFNIPISSQKAVGKLNLFLNYQDDDGRFTASLFAKNVTNEQVKGNVIVVSSLIGSLALSQYQPARQIGASLGYRF
ncbi:TonB-dependent receptor [Niveispirillum sp.]|uniref:TonB-dependent receptor n=1 Tax=Niveispirillum sp. TaxID=1917217 RepID=UPI001B3F4F18|nr:TonB-dependent receptor [Niveispirillum sp.]MBP7335287.1 TonB-dependent receptor [Niveispirillum sp.]